MSKLLELADRVEALMGPDREVDAEIALALGLAGNNIFVDHHAKGWCVGGVGQPHLSHEYTTLIDAAKTLVPEGWRWMAGHREHPHGRAYVENGKPAFDGIGMRRNPERLWFEVTAATPALALCAAALRARHAVEREDRG